MDSTYHFARRVATQAATAGRWIYAILGVFTVAASVVAAWRFGLAWGLVAFLTALEGLTFWAGQRTQKELDFRGGTFIPPEYAASISGEQNGVGTWVAPGYKVKMSPGILTDERGNTVGPGRIVGPEAHGNTLI